MRASAQTPAAADAARTHEVSRLDGPCPTDREGIPSDVGRHADVEVLAHGLAEVEHRKRLPRAAGVDLLHVGIFLEDLVQPLSPDVLHLTPQRDGDIALDPRQRDEPLVHQLRVEGLSPRREKINPVLVPEHDVDGPQPGSSIRPHRRDETIC